MSFNQSNLRLLTSYSFYIAFIISILGLALLVADFGFNQSSQFQIYLNTCYFIVLIVGISTTLLRYIFKYKSLKVSVLIFDSLTILLTLAILIAHFFGEEATQHIATLYDDNWVKLAIILTFIREFSEQNISYKRTFLNPAQLFVLSFLIIILIGSLLLMLPNATYNGISYIDALFTSTSAVCVTGLIVVDTGSYFTTFGQTIILILIQVGGLGILTFASYFSYFFKGGETYENRLTLSDMTGSKKIGEVFSTLKQVILITFSIELFSAVIIYFTLDKTIYQTFIERAFFSVFHSISAFCNAGFSTLSNGLFDNGFRYNYSLQLVIIFSFVLGGLGFPIVVNLLKYIKYFFKKKFLFYSGKEQLHQPWVLTLTSRITLVTTAILIIVGTILFYLNEYHNTLAEHSGFGKIVTALFGATTPRTAGFNTVDMSALNFSTVLLVILLMWIGASPASTGGGIKTNTFAIAVLNFLSLARGKTRIELFRREIADISVRRAFAAITLSLIVIGLGIILISIFDSEKTLVSIAFECFSAYSTVGLSVGITSNLSIYSKLVIIVIMFIGRVSMLTVMIAIFKKVKQQNYRYPIEEITIN
ncbi:TrkH family potassium uptake protein [Xanthomarina sp.]|uniref:TrkH family potassium uptake protein n=1 Tax=Xanthomarina sp. TaxID=1931211 RepID=UPI002B67D20B|nr:potassium transporter TrkG [Xanthomarina sp.]HLV39774.1 potassium transporter TrkG [Xanthomarina sp.]